MNAIWHKDRKVQKDKKKEHRKKIVIASVLKPINDTRMFEKLGLSLAKSNKYLVFLVGFEGKYVNIYHNIRFKPLFGFERTSIARLFAPIRFFFYLFKIKPNIIIIQTHELLWASYLYKLFFGTKLIYDVQENYYRNLINSQSYFPLLKYPLGFYVRLKEKFIARYITHFILAEKCYLTELSFIDKDKCTVIENKYFAFDTDENSLSTVTRVPKRFVFTGTIANETGVWDAINLIRKLHKIDSEVYLVISGHFPNAKQQQKIKDFVKRRGYIKLIGDNTPMHHEDILKEIKKSSFGIISYPVNNVTEWRMPTKLYEYLANDLPVICTHNQLWADLIKMHHGGITVDYKNIDAEALYSQLYNTPFFDNNHPKTDLLWNGEEARFLDSMEQITI